MPKALPPRLYLAKQADRDPAWVIRYGQMFRRTGFLEHQYDEAKALLDEALKRHPEFTRQVPVGRAIPLERQMTIYFVTCQYPDFPIKIGIAVNVRRRVNGLQTALPYPVVVLGTVKGSIVNERFIHRDFHRLRLQGEWFRRDPALLDFIRDTCGALPEL